MSDIQIPQRNPQYVAPVQPDPAMIQALYNRPKPGEIAAGQLGDAVKALYAQYIQQQQLKASAFGEGGPALYHMLGYDKSPLDIGGSKPQIPSVAAAAQLPQPAGGGSVPPSQPPQAVAAASPGQPNQNPLSQDQYHAVAAHLGVTPDFGGYQKAIGDTTNEMVNSAQQFGPSKWGLASQKMLTDKLSALKTGMEAQKAPLEYQKTANEVAMNSLNVAEKQASIKASNAKFVTPGQANALSSGDPNQVANQFGQGATVPVEAVQFSAGQRQQKQNKAQEIEKAYQDKNTALLNAIQAINSSLELKRKTGSAQGPIRGGIASAVGDLTHGAMADSTFQLNRNNELQRSTLQHVQEVNRFNPQEVGYIGGGALAQPGEPLNVSEEKAAQAIKVLKQRLQQNVVQKNAELGAQGLPASSENYGDQGGNDIHSAAMQWAQQNPKDPRAKAIMQKAQAALNGG